MGDCNCDRSEKIEDIGRRPSKIVTYEDEFTKIVVNESWCKGCKLCVDFCPTKTLEMKGFKSGVDDLDKCTRCNMCEMRCPDFAISVEKKKEKPKKNKAADNE